MAIPPEQLAFAEAEKINRVRESVQTALYRYERLRTGEVIHDADGNEVLPEGSYQSGDYAKQARSQIINLLLHLQDDIKGQTLFMVHRETESTATIMDIQGFIADDRGELWLTHNESGQQRRLCLSGLGREFDIMFI